MSQEQDSLENLINIKKILSNINNCEIETYTDNNLNLIDDKETKKNKIFRNEQKGKLINSFSKKRFGYFIKNLDSMEKEIIVDYWNNHYIFDLFKKQKRKQLKKLIFLKPFFIQAINDINILNTINLFTKNNIKNFCSLLNLYLKKNNLYDNIK